MKKLTKRLLSCLLTILIISCVIITAIAAYSDISASTTRIGSVADISNCGAMQGFTVTASGNNNRLFALKINSAENKALLYLYKDYTTMSNSSSDEYGYFILSNFVGHANAMAIDDNYIYITCWDSGNDTGNQNKIARISRSKLWSLYQGTTGKNKGTLTSTSDGVTILTAYYNSSGAVFNSSITAMTYYKDGKFIINYPAGNSNYTFTTAYISGGKFYVNDNSTEIFQVSPISGSTSQDIGYDADCGFFITRYIGGAQNSIIWIKLNSLSGTNRVYTPDNSKYRIIKVNKSASVFTTYELESVSIGSDNCMYANVNTKTVNTDSAYATDAIIKIERPTPAGGSKNFLGTYFAQ